MKFNKICILLLTLFIALFSCTKEMSYELDTTAAHGSLQSDIDGTCLPKNVYGTFVAATALNSTNYIELQVNVTSAGSYFISTDTLNGYYFRGTGNFSAGTNTIKLTAAGTPLGAGTNNFLIAFDSSFCYVPVTVFPEGIGQAVFTFEGSGGSCMDAVVNGTYSPGVALTTDNKVDIKINVSAIGTYSITTTAVNGMTFAGTWALTTTGPQVITLTGTGTPLNAETSVISISAGSSSCTFPIKVEDASSFDYFPRTVNSNWTYAINGDLNDMFKNYVISQTLSAGGNTYNIFLQDDGSSIDSAGNYRKAGSDYHNYLDVGSLLGLDNPLWGDVIFLKDNVPTGTSWTSDPFSGTVGGLPVDVRARFTITQKGQPIVVNSVSYPNTIAVKTGFESNLGTGWIDNSAYTFYIISYYALNVGLIKTEYYLGTGVLQESDDLVSYQVF